MRMTENHQIHRFILKKHLQFPRWPSSVPDNMLNHNPPASYNDLRPHGRQTGRIHVSQNTADRGNALEFRQYKIRTHIAGMEDVVRTLQKVEHLLRKTTMCIR